MDDYTKAHFDRWVKSTIPKEDEEIVRRQILSLLRDDPGLIVGRSWPELRIIAEGREATR